MAPIRNVGGEEHQKEACPVQKPAHLLLKHYRYGAPPHPMLYHPTAQAASIEPQNPALSYRGIAPQAVGFVLQFLHLLHLNLDLSAGFHCCAVSSLFLLWFFHLSESAGHCVDQTEGLYSGMAEAVLAAIAQRLGSEVRS